MESYYNNMFQQNSSRRGSTTIDRLTDPETVTNYLCGYSLRICTLYLLWFHVVFDIFVFCTMLLANTYLKFQFKKNERQNATLYTVVANNKKIFDIDMYSTGLDSTLEFIIEKLALFVFSMAVVDVIITIMALLGVYLKKLLLMLPYVVPIFLIIVWCIIVLLIEIIGSLTKRLQFSWILITLVLLVLIKDGYRFTVLYSYFHMIGRHCFSAVPRTPRYTSTRSPRRVHSPVDTVTTGTIAPSKSTPATALMALAKTEVPSESEIHSPKISSSSQTSDKDLESEAHSPKISFSSQTSNKDLESETHSPKISFSSQTSNKDFSSQTSNKDTEDNG